MEWQGSSFLPTVQQVKKEAKNVDVVVLSSQKY